MWLTFSVIFIEIRFAGIGYFKKEKRFIRLIKMGRIMAIRPFNG